MTLFPEEDSELKRFLQQHRPPTPLPESDLEHRILATIAQTQVLQQAERRRFLSVWLVPSAIAVSLVAGFAGYRLWFSPTPSAAELASIESFMESSWQNTVNGAPNDENLIVSDTN